MQIAIEVFVSNILRCLVIKDIRIYIRIIIL